MKKGIDVSYCQGKIDFSRIDKNQVQFAVIRSSFGWEANQKDEYFERNYKGFRSLGIPVGAYHYSYAKTKEEAIKEAKYCLECIKGKSFELPVFIDMEEQNCAAAGRRACTDVAKAFISTMEKAGYKSGIYTNPNWLENYLYKGEIVGKVNLWLAQWGSSKPYCNCMLWQYNVGKSGSVSGISGEIDLDYCYKGIENSSSDATKAPDIWYQVNALTTWQPYVKNLTDFAGIENRAVYALRIKKSTIGDIIYRVHVIGKGWLPWVKNNTDYAGRTYKDIPIDGVQIYTNNKNYTVKYRVSPRDGKYYDWITGYSNDPETGYAGEFGKPIDKIQMCIIKK